MLFYIWRKVTEFLGDMQENGDFFAIFSLEDAAEALQVIGYRRDGRRDYDPPFMCLEMK